MPSFDEKLDQLQAKLPTLDPEKRARAEALLAKHGRKTQAAGPAPAAPPTPGHAGPAQAPAPAKPQAAPQAPQVVSGFESAARGVGQGLTSDFGEEASSAIASGAHKLFTGEGDIPRSATRGSRAPLSDRTDYDVIRDAERADNAAAREANPELYVAGEIGGAALQTPLTGLGGRAVQGTRAGLVANGLLKAPKALGAGGKLLRGGASLAAQGGVMGAGASEAQDAAGVAKDAATGAVVNTALGGALHTGAKLVGGAVDKAKRLRQIGTARRLRAAGIDPNTDAMLAPGSPEPAPAPGLLDRVGKALDVGEEPVVHETSGATRQVANMKAQGIGTGVEGTPKIAAQAGQAVRNIEDTRGRILQDNAGAGSDGALGLEVGTRLRLRRNAGTRPRTAQRRALRDEADAERLAEEASAKLAAAEAKAKHQVAINDYKANQAAREAPMAEPLAQGATAAGRVRAKGLRRRAGVADTVQSTPPEMTGVQADPAAATARPSAPDAPTVPDQDLLKMADAAELQGQRQAGRLRNPRPQTPPAILQAQHAAADLQAAKARAQQARAVLPPEQAGDRAALNEQIRHFENPANMSPSVQDLNARRKSFSFESEGRPAREDLSAGVRDDLNSVIQGALNRSSQGAGDNWRRLAAQEAAAITARESATRASNQASGGMGFGDMIAALVGDTVGAHSLRAKAAEVGSAAYGSPIMRRLLSPGAPVAADALGRMAAGEGIRKVQSYGDAESRAREHFLQSLKNPEYRALTHED